MGTICTYNQSFDWLERECKCSNNKKAITITKKKVCSVTLAIHNIIDAIVQAIHTDSDQDWPWSQAHSTWFEVIVTLFVVCHPLIGP